MSAKQQAIKDIKEVLKKSNKCFINYVSELTPVMNKLTKEYIYQQQHQCKFKVGDIISAIYPDKGVEKARVLQIIMGKKGKYKDKLLYKLKIMNGILYLPVSAEVSYKLINPK